MKRIFFLLLFVVCFSFSRAQDFKFYEVNKMVKEFNVDNDFSTPLKAFISTQNLMANGQISQLYAKSSYKIRLSDPKGWADEEISKEEQIALLSTEIKKIITYRDSVAAVITISRDSNYVYRFFNLEQGIWVNGGEDMRKGLATTEKKIYELLPLRLTMLQRTNEVMNTPTDTIAFSNFLEKNGQEPKHFLLNALSQHKLVIYGERHREKLSWQLLKDLVNDPAFRKTTGTIFMELQSYKQSEIDRFFSNTAYMDSSIIVGIYQDMQLPGWYDKGGFEFLITLWEINKKLPVSKKIKVVFVDYQLPFRNIYTKEELKDANNKARKRNTNMADVIERTMKNSSDIRHNLFIVGYAHAYKSSAIEEYGESPEGVHSAANQLVTRFSDKDIFCTRVHVSGINGYVRGGMFDLVFKKRGASPVAFNLKGSPFGKEIIEDWAWEKDSFGTFENNYDGYIYLGGEPINKYPEYRLSEIYTEDFVKELKRRAYLFGIENTMWFGVPNKSLTLEALLKDLNDN